MVETDATGRPFPGFGNIKEDVIAAVDETYDLGSIDKKWAALWVAIAMVTSITIGGVVKISTTGTTLLINESTQIQGDLTIDDNLTATNINATGLYYGNGSQLTGVLTSYTETDPYWTGNSTLVPYLASVNIFTANQNLTAVNISAMDCIIFDSGGKICSGV